MNPFNLRKFLTENKLTPNSRVIHPDVDPQGLKLAYHFAQSFSSYIVPSSVQYSEDDEGTYTLEFNLEIPPADGSPDSIEDELYYRSYNGPGRSYTKVNAHAYPSDTGDIHVNVIARGGYDI